MASSVLSEHLQKASRMFFAKLFLHISLVLALYFSVLQSRAFSPFIPLPSLEWHHGHEKATLRDRVKYNSESLENPAVLPNRSGKDLHQNQLSYLLKTQFPFWVVTKDDWFLISTLRWLWFWVKLKRTILGMEITQDSSNCLSLGKQRAQETCLGYNFFVQWNSPIIWLENDTWKNRSFWIF